MLHGTQQIDLQIVNAIHVHQIMPSIADKIPFENTLALKLDEPLQKNANNRTLLLVLILLVG